VWFKAFFFKDAPFRYNLHAAQLLPLLNPQKMQRQEPSSAAAAGGGHMAQMIISSSTTINVQHEHLYTKNKKINITT